MHMKMMVLAGAFVAATAAPGLAEGDAAKGETVFKRCSACHAIGPDAKNKVGPQLNGIIGRTVASAPDYNYSPAMKKVGESGQVWTREELQEFLSAPKKKIPGNKMTSAGVSKPDDLENLLTYIESAAGKPAE